MNNHPEQVLLPNIFLTRVRQHVGAVSDHFRAVVAQYQENLRKVERSYPKLSNNTAVQSAVLDLAILHVTKQLTLPDKVLIEIFNPQREIRDYFRRLFVLGILPACKFDPRKISTLRKSGFDSPLNDQRWPAYQYVGYFFRRNLGMPRFGMAVEILKLAASGDLDKFTAAIRIVHQVKITSSDECQKLFLALSGAEKLVLLRLLSASPGSFYRRVKICLTSQPRSTPRNRNSRRAVIPRFERPSRDTRPRARSSLKP